MFFLYFVDIFHLYSTLLIYYTIYLFTSLLIIRYFRYNSSVILRDGNVDKNSSGSEIEDHSEVDPARETDVGAEVCTLSQQPISGLLSPFLAFQYNLAI